ncbi:MAG TPA: protease HtpX [Sulfuricaulis sp.]|nr:protease HtpX [Sulfuricaulis sp.]
MKRILLFVATNIAVLFVLSISASILIRVLGIQEMPGGLNLQSLVIFAAVIGFGGSFISLAMSKWMAKRATGATVIEQPRNSTEQWLIETVRRLAKQAGIGMPEVAVYEGPDVNAFATGMSRDSALVAVSTGLLNAMDKDEAEAVLGHEITHVSNGDMVTLALIQGVLNTFVIVLSRVVGYFVDRVLLKNDRDSMGVGFFVSSMVAQILLGILASMIVMWFSRQREFRADAGGAKLAGRDKMIAALNRLKAMHEPAQLPDQMAAFGISGAPAGGFKRLFMSHPPLDERIAALKQVR